MASRHSVAVLVPFVVSCLALAGLAGPAAADPSGTVQITPDAGSNLTDTITPLAGSSQFAVLVRRHTSLASTVPDWGDDLVARAADGSTTDLGVTGRLDDWSLVGRVLSGDDGSLLPPSVSWWDIPAGTRGTVTLATGQSYLGGAPDGFLVEDGDRLLRRSTAGTVTDLGTPFPGSTRFLAVSGDDGVVLHDIDRSQPHSLVYQSFADPGTFTPLPTSGLGDLTCSSLVGGYAGCISPDTGKPALLPVDGTRPPTVGPSGGATAVSVVVASPTRATLVWQAGHDNTLHSLGYGSTTANASTIPRGPGLVSAYSAALLVDPSYHQVLRVTSATSTPSVVYRAARSPVTASDLSLSPGRLVHNDDRQVSAPFASSTFSTALSTSSSPLVVGATGAVHKGTSPVTALGSGTSTVYSRPGGTGNDQTRVVRTPHGSKALRTLAGDSYFGPGNLSGSLSGNRFVYAVDLPGGHVPVYLYDASTGRSTVVQRELGHVLPVVFGDYLASVHPDGSVWRRNLVTGATTRLSAPLPLQVNFGQLFAWGDYVGWNLYAGDDDEGTGPTSEAHAYRDARTLAPARSFSTPIHGLSSAGVVLASASIDFDPLHANAYTLETYGGTTVPLLPSARYVAGPQVEGTTAAWIDGSGLLKAAPVAVPAVAPRFLGAPLAPSRINNAGRVGWRAYAPYSAPLTTCSADILHGSRVVRRLACDRVRMKVGVADVGWDATYAGHPAHAGIYRYRIVARGDGGAALDGSGGPRPVVHTIAVGRPTRTGLYAAPPTVRRGAPVVLRAPLTTTGGSRHGARQVSFYRRLASGTWKRVGTVRTASGGVARIVVRPGGTATYRASFRGSFADRPSISRTVTVRVR